MSAASVWIFFWNNKTFNLSNMMGYQSLVSHSSDEKHILDKLISKLFQAKSNCMQKMTLKFWRRTKLQVPNSKQQGLFSQVLKQLNQKVKGHFNIYLHVIVMINVGISHLDQESSSQIVYNSQQQLQDVMLMKIC